MLKLVPLCGEVDDYPEGARPRLRQLGERGEQAGLEWRRRDRGGTPAESTDAELGEWGGVRDWLALALIVVLGPGLWLLGIAAVIYLLVDLLF